MGFAISEQTVQQRIATLKTARAAPTPTPTLRPPPTPVPWTSGSFGPVSGELRHNPSENTIKIRYANVHVSDFILSVNFINPYSPFTNPWDYGFIVRDSGPGPTTRFIEVVVTSDRRWEVLWRWGSNNEGHSIADGYLSNFDSRANGENRLWLAAIGSKGVLFVNGEFISMLDLSDVTGPGDVAVITGAFRGDEIAGAVTRFEDFRVDSIRQEYGPANGKLEYAREFISEQDSGVWARDIVAEAEFTSPPGANWSYGFLFRYPESNRLEAVGVAGNNWWFHNTIDVGDDEYTDVAKGRLRLGNRNHLLLFVIGDSGILIVNGEQVARLDLSHNLDYGRVSVMAGWFSSNTGEPVFENFNVWTPEP